MKKTDATIVVDRSTSMRSMQSKAEEGVNTFIQQLRDAGGECQVTIFDFASQGTFSEPLSGPIGDCPDYSLRPNGNTALNDAIAEAMERTGNRLRAMPEEDRPEIVYFNIMTDGDENDSKEFSRHTGGDERVKALVKHQEEKYSWLITFMGAGLNVARQALRFGINPLNTTVFAATPDAVFTAYTGNAQRLNNLRSGKTTRAEYASVASVAADGNEEDEEARVKV